MLTTQEAQAALVNANNLLSAMPNHGFGRAAFARIVEKEYLNVWRQKMERFNHPVPLNTDGATN